LRAGLAAENTKAKPECQTSTGAENQRRNAGLRFVVEQLVPGSKAVAFQAIQARKMILHVAVTALASLCLHAELMSPVTR